jgi:hypothetical protein
MVYQARQKARNCAVISHRRTTTTSSPVHPAGSLANRVPYFFKVLSELLSFSHQPGTEREPVFQAKKFPPTAKNSQSETLPLSCPSTPPSEYASTKALSLALSRPGRTYKSYNLQSKPGPGNSKVGGFVVAGAVEFRQAQKNYTSIEGEEKVTSTPYRPTTFVHPSAVVEAALDPVIGRPPGSVDAYNHTPIRDRATNIEGAAPAVTSIEEAVGAAPMNNTVTDIDTSGECNLAVIWQAVGEALRGRFQSVQLAETALKMKLSFGASPDQLVLSAPGLSWLSKTLTNSDLALFRLALRQFLGRGFELILA